PVRVRISIARDHSSSVSCTSDANACRWRISACTFWRNLGSGQPSKLAMAAEVISAAAELGPRAMVVMRQQYRPTGLALASGDSPPLAAINRNARASDQAGAV